MRGFERVDGFRWTGKDYKRKTVKNQANRLLGKTSLRTKLVLIMRILRGQGVLYRASVSSVYGHGPYGDIQMVGCFIGDQASCMEFVREKELEGISSLMGDQ